MSTVEESYYKQSIDEMVEYMSGMAKYSEEQLKTLVYWSIATHAHHLLKKFAILRLTSTTGTGKSNATKFVADISRAPTLDGILGSKANFQSIKGSTPASVREIISAANKQGGTCCFDESDKFPTEYYESIFDRDGSQTHKMTGSGSKFTLDKTINLWAPVIMNGRKFLEDESNQNRTIEINTFSDIEWAKVSGGEYDLGHFAHFREMFSELSEKIDWDEALSGNNTRAKQCWAPLKSVAEYLGDEEFLSYIDSQIEKAYSDSIVGRAEEIDYKVIEAMITLCWYEVETLGKEFPYKLKVQSVATKVSESPRAVAKTLRILKVKVTKSGVSWAVGINPEMLKKLCLKAGVRTDEWLESKTRKVGFMD